MPQVGMAGSGPEDDRRQRSLRGGMSGFLPNGGVARKNRSTGAMPFSGGAANQRFAAAGKAVRERIAGRRWRRE